MFTTLLLTTTFVTATPAQPQPSARIKIDIDRTIGEVDPLLFGNFAEHLGRMIYGGIYEEGSPLSDQYGFRKDVMEAVRRIERHHPALARRQLRLRLQLEGRHRPEGSTSRAARTGLERRRVEPLRHR